MWTTAITSATLLLTLAGVAAAQEGPREQGQEMERHGMMRMGPMQGMGPMHPMEHGPRRAMMRVMTFHPRHLIEKKDLLGLSPDQVAKLTSLQESARKAADDAQARAKAAHEAMAQAMAAGKPDPKKLQGHFQAAHEAMGQAQWTRMNAALQARAVLTEVQRARVQGWVDAMQAGPMGGGRERMMGGPHREPQGK